MTDRVSRSETLIDLFLRTVERTPDRTAVSDDVRSLSYAALWDHAGGFGTLLIELGVRPGDRVVVYRERGVDVLVELLGILAVGAAYVAVDSRYPDARRDLMICDSRPALIVTEPGWGRRVADLGPPVVEWTAPASAQAQLHTPTRAEPDGAACILFTSGSKGRPKAIVLSHRNLAYFAVNPALPVPTEQDRTGQISSLSFDAFHYETWCSLAAGAEVAVIPAIADLIALDLQRELRRRRITVLLAPTMAVNHAVYEDRDAFTPLRLLHTGGDVLELGAVRELLAGTFDGEFCNLYGPAEGSTACTMYRLGRTAPAAGHVPIGVPLAGAHVYLLDSELNPVPVGVQGELHIGGVGVARGYLDRPALTADRFLPDPHLPGSRMYATGDLARYGADGLLDFVGRLDDQVKIRGYRVEPREVERTITDHPAVRETAVVPVGSSHDRRLVALVVVTEQVSPQDLRDYATHTLPDYMVPSSFVQVPSIPGGSHGKRDSVKLEELARSQDERRARWVPPIDDVERYLAGVWEEMLGVEWVSSDDDFFHLGGNSMLAFRLQRRISRDLQVPLDSMSVFESRSLTELGTLIRRIRTSV